MKQFWLLYLVIILFTGTVAVLSAWTFGPRITTLTELTSPLPDFLTSFYNKQVSTLSVWIPSANASLEKSTKPEITAKSALVYDLTTDTVLYSKNDKERLPMASITKIMTAIISLENPRSDNTYIVSPSALVGENSMGLTQNEVMTLEKLLYGMLLPSGNDAAEVLAQNYPRGDRSAFIQAMNDKAKALGAVDTNFTNPSGLEGDGNQYTTVRDLVIITRYAMAQFPQFRKVVSTYEYHIPYTKDHKEFYLYNETNLITSYPGVKGVKDGYTPEAGLCLVTYLDYGGHQMIGVVLGSESRRSEMKELLDYSLKVLDINPPQHS